MIKIIDYGLGNIRAFINLYERLNIHIASAKTTKDLNGATKLILPGVGAFDHAMEKLNNSGMREPLDELVLKKGIPVIGICVGMQILAESSEEGDLDGLGWIKGKVVKFDFTDLDSNLQLPHMGWNTIHKDKESPLLKDLDNHSRFYFLHSYYFKCCNSSDAIVSTEYGKSFTCVVNNRNIYGVQFHPEKSHQWGIKLLKNFAEL